MSYTGLRGARTRTQRPRAGHAPLSGHQRPSLEGSTSRHHRRQPRITPGMGLNPRMDEDHEDREYQMRRERAEREYHTLEPSTSTERSLQRRQEGYYMQTPKPSQNQKLKTTAQVETEAYAQHREDKKQRLAEESYRHPPRALGGAAVSAEEVRKKQEREHQLNAKYASTRRKQKREEYVRAKKQREDEELEKMKRVQREKGQKLEQKHQVQRVEQREEIRRKRLEHFDRQSRPGD